MNKDKIIKDLKEKNRKLKNQYELQEARLYSSQHKVDELKEENKRLNNIINELEKWYKKQYEDTNKCLDYAREHHNLQDTEKYTRDHNMIAMCIEKLEKLQELKEGK